MSTVSTTQSEPWQLVYDDMPDEEFVDGLRLSTDCVARRLIEPLDRERYFGFPEHLGHRGHGFERILQEWLELRFGVPSMREVVVPWEFGESHLDLLLPTAAPAFDTNGRTLQVELKANKEAQVKTENVRQVQRQMFAMERALERKRPLRVRIKVDGEWEWTTIDPQLYADAEWRILVIDPATWRIPNPLGVRVTISDDRRLELEAEWAAMAEFMSRKPSSMRYDIEWASRMPVCSCGKCFAPTLEALDQKLVEHAALYAEAQKEEAFAKNEKDLAGAYLKSQLIEGLPPERGQSWVGGGWKVTLSKQTAKGGRTLYVNPSDAKPAPQL